MQGNQNVIAVLNDGLKKELTAVSQYFLHAEMCAAWGYDRLHAIIKKRSIEEMKHAERFVERILFLEGAPSMGDLFPVKIGASVKAQFDNDLALELVAVAAYNAAIKVCTDAGDATSRDLFEQLIHDEEGHVDWIEAQLHQAAEIGMERYLSQQIKP